jgi:hypothetical protein
MIDNEDLQFQLATIAQEIRVLGLMMEMSHESWTATARPEITRAAALSLLLSDRLEGAESDALRYLGLAVGAMAPPRRSSSGTPDPVDYDAVKERWEGVRRLYGARVPGWVLDIT